MSYTLPFSKQEEEKRMLSYTLPFSGQEVNERLQKSVRMDTGLVQHFDGNYDKIIKPNDWKTQRIITKATHTCDPNIDSLRISNPGNKPLSIKLKDAKNTKLTTIEVKAASIVEEVLTTRPASLEITGGDTDTKVYECIPSNEITMTVQGLKTINDHVIISPAIGSIDNYNYFNIICKKQGATTLTFSCDVIPNKDIELNILIFGFYQDIENEPEDDNSKYVSLEEITTNPWRYYILPEEIRQGNPTTTDKIKYNKTLFSDKDIYYRYSAYIKNPENNSIIYPHYFRIAVNLNEITRFAFVYNKYDEDPDKVPNRYNCLNNRLYYYYPSLDNTNNNWDYIGSSSSSNKVPLDVSYATDDDNKPTWLYIYINRADGTLLPDSNYADFILSYTVKTTDSKPVHIECIAKDTDLVRSIVVPNNDKYGLIEIPSTINDSTENINANAIITNFRDTGLNPIFQVYSFSLQANNTYKISLPDSIVARAISEINGEIKLDLSHLTATYTPEANEKIIFAITQDDLTNGVFKNSNNESITNINDFKTWIANSIEKEVEVTNS